MSAESADPTSEGQKPPWMGYVTLGAIAIAAVLFAVAMFLPDRESSPDYSAGQYSHSYNFCLNNATEVREQAATSSDSGAARWYSESYRDGAPRDEAYAGCLDALSGRGRR